ncbi:GTP cyclohydrolase FolE2 [Neptunomonas japonica]|uniref:GTP cyclohydrolase FolE2 n=1 Tax=Neptunomonas japonica JAMM 1380 TaxID=1441457 RepID=A0A7R6PBN9_9GAMM|nr:GTP cyclohydrolase FolE2 [Neptunomonas japonica]BBB30754.1 GTP cyclohydrolase [Neptunomonas japonica JAMM 1380]
MNSLALPDVASQLNSYQDTPLKLVGMQGIALPIRLAGQPLNAYVDAGVSLDKSKARGIHMSRLYLALEALEDQELTVPLLNEVLDCFLDSHSDLSTTAHLSIKGDVLFKRPALLSQLAGWKAYPFEVNAIRSGQETRITVKLDIGYSSTCPCSAALARQLIQKQFNKDFAGKDLQHAELHDWLGSSQGIVATPHSQRSTATLTVHLAEQYNKEFPLLVLLERVESALGTALQTAVKRVDEQAFALANGQNTMFCEDAARRIHQALLEEICVQGFHLRIAHMESLHAHDAVAESAWNWGNQK